jgi:hypothetical protein
MDVTTEPGADGLPQLVIPGAERASPVSMLIHHMAQPKRSTKPQRPVDQGLFDTEARNQLSLF